MVSECCQGHSDSCPAGEARWVVFRFAKYGKLREDVEPVRVAHSDHVTTGCADGLAFHEATQTLVASCPGGVCLVDLDAGEVRAKMRSRRADLPKTGRGGAVRATWIVRG